MNGVSLWRDPAAWLFLASFALLVSWWCYRAMTAWLDRRSQVRLHISSELHPKSASLPSFEPLRSVQRPQGLRRYLLLLGWTHESSYQNSLMVCAVAGLSAVLVAASVMVRLYDFNSPRQWALAACVLVAVALLASLMPLVVLRRMAIRAQARAHQNFAHALDLLGMGLLSGLSLQQTIERIVQVLHDQSPVLGRAFFQVGLMLKAGAPLQRAWTELERLVWMPEIQSLINNLVQSEQLGTPVTSILANHAHAIRLHQQLQAQARVGKIRTWLIMPLVFCQLPALLAIMIGPSLLQTLDLLGNVAS